MVVLGLGVAVLEPEFCWTCTGGCAWPRSCIRLAKASALGSAGNSHKQSAKALATRDSKFKAKKFNAGPEGHNLAKGTENQRGFA